MWVRCFRPPSLKTCARVFSAKTFLLSGSFWKRPISSLTERSIWSSSMSSSSTSSPSSAVSSSSTSSLRRRCPHEEPRYRGRFSSPCANARHHRAFPELAWLQACGPLSLSTQTWTSPALPCPSLTYARECSRAGLARLSQSAAL